MQSLRSLLEAIRAGDLTADEAIAQSRARIAQADGDIGAFACLADTPRAGTGPLAGIAVGVKDIIDTADLPTQMGSPIYAGWQPRADAAIVCALKAAGATVIGKTETTPFAFLDPARTRNPHDLGATPGGSSAGSAAAVAAGMVPLAVGTQTGGSVIRPAAFCGTAAIKPSFGILPMVGIKPFSWSLDTAGLFAATVGDAGFALAAMTGRADLDAPPAPLKGLRLGILRQGAYGTPEPASMAALARACDLLRSAGATIFEAAEPEAFDQAFAVLGAIQSFEAAQALAFEYRAHAPALPPKLRAYLDAARQVGATQYDDARRLARRGRDASRGFFAEADAYLTFSAPGEAPAGLDSTGDPCFNKLWTLLGVPCANVPVTRGTRGLPVCLQVIAGFGRDAAAVAVAAALEATFLNYGEG